MNRFFSRPLACAFMLTFLGDSCSGISLENGSFRWQKNGDLGAWEVTTGRIQQAPTWDEADRGVELMSNPTEIAQTLTATTTCGQVTIMGKVEKSAHLTVGTSSSVSIPALDWESHTFYLTFAGSRSDWTDDPQADVRYERGNTLKIRKNGDGTAIIAQISVQGASGCGPSTAR